MVEQNQVSEKINHPVLLQIAALGLSQGFVIPLFHWPVGHATAAVLIIILVEKYMYETKYRVTIQV